MHSVRNWRIKGKRKIKGKEKDKGKGRVILPLMVVSVVASIDGHECYWLWSLGHWCVWYCVKSVIEHGHFCVHVVN